MNRIHTPMHGVQIVRRAHRSPRADARLIELVAQFRRLRKELDAVHRREDECAAWDERYVALQAEVDVLVRRCWRIREAVSNLPARTAAGLRAKAWLAAWETTDGDIEAGPSDHPDVAVAWSLAHDLMGGAAL